jgi:antitoxin component YwqK of YwqJK toxin-antitoxin module
MRRFYLALLTTLVCCSSKFKNQDPKLVSVQVTDRHGMQQTISQPDRLKKFEGVNFLEPQPYEKVMCHYKKGKKPVSKVVSYHKNGFVMQTLDVVESRAYGEYKEFFDDGKLRLQARLIEGIADVTPYAQESWVFDGLSQVYYQSGVLKASIPYEKGVLQGECSYFREDGTLLRKSTFVQGVTEGEEVYYGIDGQIMGKIFYHKGLRNGKAWFLDTLSGLNINEFYEHGKLTQASYLDRNNNIVSFVENGYGTRSVYEDGVLVRTEEIQGGVVEGKICFYNKLMQLEHSLMQKNLLKEGEEWFFYADGKPKLKVVWENDQIHGVVQSWYENGLVESERMYSSNKKEGSAFAWYQDGSRMLIEEYENDLLVNGRYYKKGDNEPVSRVKDGEGVVTLFDAKGNLLKKVHYRKGLPVNG